MAMKMKSGENSRFTDLCDEPVDRLLSPIKGYQDKPLVSLSEAIQPVSNFFNEIEDNVYVALHNCQNPRDELTKEESASIHLYTMEFDDGPSLYNLLNRSLRTENRQELIPWFLYLKLFLTALYKLPSQNGIVWRGVKNVDLTSKYKKGRKFAWWGISSCTTDLEVLQSNAFLGKHGLRTLFSIECINGKSIINHSYFKQTEQELILMPGSYFEVMGQLNPADQLYIIQLKESSPPITLVKPPFNKSNNLNPSPSSSSSSSSSSSPQSTSNINKQNKSKNIISKQILLKSNTKWKQNGLTIAGGNGQGNQLNQLYNPYSIYIDDENQNIYIADCLNHRILKWRFGAKNGQVDAGEKRQEDKIDPLNQPADVIIDKENNSLIISDCGNRRVMRYSPENNTNGKIIISDIDCYGLAMDKKGSIYVSDYKKNEVRRWERGGGSEKGRIVAGGHGKGDELNQLNGPTHIFIDEDDSLYISDTWNHRVIKWVKDAKEGIIIAGGNGQGNRYTQLCYPCGIIIDQLGQIYVADHGNDRVMRWCPGDEEGTIIVGSNGQGQQSNQLNGPKGLLFDQQGNIYVADWGNHRILKFEIN